MADPKINKNEEFETYVSPYGYIHAFVQEYDTDLGRKFKKSWVYVGRYAINKKGNMVKNHRAHGEFAGGPSWAYPEVDTDSLKAEMSNPSPDRDALWGEGEHAKGYVDVEDPTMQEELIRMIRNEIKGIGRIREKVK